MKRAIRGCWEINERLLFIFGMRDSQCSKTRPALLVSAWALPCIQFGLWD